MTRVTQSFVDPRAGNQDALNRPWLTDPLYGGMSVQAAEKSWRAAQTRRQAEQSRHAARPEPLVEKSSSPIVLLNRPEPVARKIRFIPLREIEINRSRRYRVKGIMP